MLQNCLLFDNDATGRGGGVYLTDPSVGGGTDIVNCTITLNRSKLPGVGTQSGPGIWVDGGNGFSVVRNCIVRNNIGTGIPGTPQNITGGGTYYAPSPGTKIHVRFSNVGTMGVYFGNGNINQLSLFVSEVLRNFQLLPGSPCLDVGKNAFLLKDMLDMDDDGDFDEPTPWDLNSVTRIIDLVLAPNGPFGPVDMGAYETPIDIR